jgi:hypothetical protein
MDALGKIFNNNKVKILGGDVASGEWEYSLGTLWGAFEQIDLRSDVKKVTPQTEESVKKLPEAAAWGLLGLALGPMGLLAGVVFGGNRKSVCALVELNDGRKFLAVMDSKIYQEVLGISITNAK